MKIHRNNRFGGVASYKPSSIGLKNGVVDKQWVLSFLQGIQDRNLMSPRYADFLKTISGLAMGGKISFEFQDPGIGKTDDSCLYIIAKKLLKITKPTTLEDKSARAEFEGALVHELYHGYQDKNVSKGPTGNIEAEAYLAVSDFLNHAYPSQLSNTWVVVRPRQDQKAGYSVRFNAPKRVVDNLSSANYDQSVEIVAHNYLSSVPFLAALFSDTVMSGEERFCQIAQQNPSRFNVGQQIQQTVNTFERSGQTHVQVKKNGDKFNFTFSPPLLNFMIVARVHVQISLRTKGFDEASIVLDQYYRSFRELATPRGSNIFTIINPEVVFDGIQ